MAGAGPCDWPGAGGGPSPWPRRPRRGFGIPGDELEARSGRTARPGRRRRRRDPRRRPRHRRRAGRSRRDGRSAPAAAAGAARASDYDRPETIEETAELVDAARRHRRRDRRSTISIPTQVRRWPTRIRADHGHIDVLVNDIWGAEVLKGGPPSGTRRSGSTTSTTGLRILRLGDRHPPRSRRTTCCRCSSTGPAGCSSRSPTAPPSTTRRTTGSRCSTTWPRSR